MKEEKDIYRVTVRADHRLYKAVRIKLIAEDSNFTEWLNKAMMQKLMEGKE